MRKFHHNKIMNIVIGVWVYSQVGLVIFGSISLIINMHNQTQLIMISKRLFPDKNVFNLTKQEQQQVLSIYNEFN